MLISMSEKESVKSLGIRNLFSLMGNGSDLYPDGQKPLYFVMSIELLRIMADEQDASPPQVG